MIAEALDPVVGGGTSAPIREGILRFLDHYCQPASNDVFVLAYSLDSRRYAALLALELTRLQVRTVTCPMRPLSDEGFAERLYSKLPSPSEFSGKIVVVSLELQSMSHFDVFYPFFQFYGVARTRVIRVISASDAFFNLATVIPPHQQEALNGTLLDFLEGAQQIQVTSPGGTDLSMTLKKDLYSWVSNRGKHRPGAFNILPAGEIATYCDDVSGRLVADGALNCNASVSLDTRLSQNPVVFDLKNSAIQDKWFAENELGSFMEECFAMPNSHLVGEVGFGTNVGISEFVALNSHLNERHLSLHIGFGQHNQEPSAGLHEADIHMDFITNDATITRLDTGEALTLSNLEVREGVRHPDLIRDQDITGDCCSAGCRVITLG